MSHLYFNINTFSNLQFAHEFTRIQGHTTCLLYLSCHPLSIYSCLSFKYLLSGYHTLGIVLGAWYIISNLTNNKCTFNKIFLPVSTNTTVDQKLAKGDKRPRCPRIFSITVPCFHPWAKTALYDLLPFKNQSVNLLKPPQHGPNTFNSVSVSPLHFNLTQIVFHIFWMKVWHPSILIPM